MNEEQGIETVHSLREVCASPEPPAYEASSQKTAVDDEATPTIGYSIPTEYAEAFKSEVHEEVDHVGMNAENRKTIVADATRTVAARPRWRELVKFPPEQEGAEQTDLESASESIARIAHATEALRSHVSEVGYWPHKPSVGRVVHYVDAKGWHLAAVMTCYHFGPDGAGRVDLHVYPHRATAHGEWAAAANHAEVEMDESGAPHTWHWPERE